MKSNKVFFHNSDNGKKIIIKYMLCLIPLVFYGLYKNGILLYNNNFVSILLVPKIIYMLIISFIIYILIDVIIFKKKRIFSFDLLYLLIIPLFLPQNTNLLIYSVGLFVSFLLASILERKVKFNKMAFCKLFIILLLIIFSLNNYLNPSEELNIYSLNFWDLLWGRNIGGIASTNIILGLVILFIFCFISSYKKVIAISSIIVFLICSYLFSGFDIMVFQYSSAILGLIILNVDSISTPHNKISMFIYGISLGLLVSLTTIFIDINESVFICTLFSSFFSPILDKIIEK